MVGLADSKLNRTHVSVARFICSVITIKRAIVAAIMCDHIRELRNAFRTLPCSRRVWFSLIVAALMLIVPVSKAAAATYFVDFTSGSDSNQGTNSALPWKHCPGDANARGIPAATRFMPGDVVKFKGGVVYLGEVILPWSGTTEAPITYDGNSSENWGRGKAIVDCNFALNSAAIKLLAGVRNVRIDGFELRNAGGYADNDPVVINAAKGLYGNSTNAIKVPRPGWGIYMAGPNANIVCANLYIHHIGIWHSTIGWDGHAVSGVGILLRSPESVTISNCEITKVGATGIGLYAVTGANNVLITDCYLHDDIPNWGIDIAPQGVNVVLSNITITKTRFIDLWSDWSGTPDDPRGTGTGAPHQNYIFFRTAGNVSSWTDVEVSRCFFGETSDSHTGKGGTGSIFISQGPSVNIYNNIFSRPWSYSGIIFIYYDVPSAMTQTCRIYNNTFYRGSGTQIVVSGASSSGGARNTYIENNILVNEPGLAANAAMIAIGDSYNYPVTLDHNIYYSSDWSVSKKYIATINGTYKTLATLQAAGFETNGLYTNPSLVGINNPQPILRNFRPKTDSPAIAAGRKLSQYFAADYEGRPRPVSGSWTIGAYNGAVQGPATPINLTIQPKK